MMVELSVIPVSRDEDFGKYVAETVRLIDESGLDYRVTPTSTIIIGEWEPVMKVVKACHDKVMSMTDRVITRIDIDHRKAADGALENQVQAIEQILGRKVKK